MSDRWNKPEGVIGAGGILDRIVEAKAIRLKEAKLLNPIDSTAQSRFHARSRESGYSFVDRISRKGVTNIIAELKSRSPSKGVIREDYNPRLIADTYEKKKPLVDEELAKLRRLDPKLADELEEYRKNYKGGLQLGPPAKLDQ